MTRLVFALGLALVLTGCSGSDADDGPSAQSTSAPSATTGPAAGEPGTTSSTTLDLPIGAPDPPQRVAQTRDRIIRAAHMFDYAALRKLLRPSAFIYSLGESGDPIRYWRRLEKVGEVPILGDILPGVLAGTGFARWGSTYVWPAAAVIRPVGWSPADRRDIDSLYGDGAADRYESEGVYTGWRVGIREDGAWVFFVTSE